MEDRPTISKAVRNVQQSATFIPSNQPIRPKSLPLVTEVQYIGNNILMSK